MDCAGAHRAVHMVVTSSDSHNDGTLAASGKAGSPGWIVLGYDVIIPFANNLAILHHNCAEASTCCWGTQAGQHMSVAGQEGAKLQLCAQGLLMWFGGYGGSFATVVHWSLSTTHTPRTLHEL